MELTESHYSHGLSQGKDIPKYQPEEEMRRAGYRAALVPSMRSPPSQGRCRSTRFATQGGAATPHCSVFLLGLYYICVLK